MKKNKSREEFNKLIESNLQRKLNNLKKGKGKRFFLTHIDYPQKQKAIDSVKINQQIKIIENNLSDLKSLIKEIKKYFSSIFDQDKYVATYLLIGKALSNLEASISLAKSGYSEELLELSRSGHESTDLTFLFLEEENKKLLVRWFKGEIIENNISRQFFEKALNKSKIINVTIELSKAKNHIYKAYSLSTHSQYTALVDLIDVFYEDLDYYKYAGFHHNASLTYYFQSLYSNILIILKTIFIKKMDQPNIDKVDKLLNEVLPKVPKNEVEQMLKDYKK